MLSNTVVVTLFNEVDKQCSIPSMNVSEQLVRINDVGGLGSMLKLRAKTADLLLLLIIVASIRAAVSALYKNKQNVL